MGFFEKWPYTNFHDLNLDKVIQKVDQVKSDMSEMMDIVRQFETTTVISSAENRPVQSRAVYQALQNLRSALIAYTDAEIAAIDNDITALETTVNGHSSSLVTLRNQIALKQDLLTFDQIPTSGSGNPVTSNGIYNALASIPAGGSDPLLVTLTGTQYNLTPDHTMTEMMEAYASGRSIWLKHGDDECQIIYLTPSSSLKSALALTINYNQYRLRIYRGAGASWSYTDAYIFRREYELTSGNLTMTAESQGFFYTWNTIMPSLNITCPTTGEYAFRFTSGTTATTLTLTGVTMPDDFSVEANRVYEINVYEGYGVAQSWEVVNASA